TPPGAQTPPRPPRRSATGRTPDPASITAWEAVRLAASAGAAPPSAAPQARQNRLPGTTGAPHDGHPPSGLPQSLQNRSPASWDAPQFPHVTISALSCADQPSSQIPRPRGDEHAVPPLLPPGSLRRARVARDVVLRGIIVRPVLVPHDVFV